MVNIRHGKIRRINVTKVRGKEGKRGERREKKGEMGKQQGE